MGIGSSAVLAALRIAAGATAAGATAGATASLLTKPDSPASATELEKRAAKEAEDKRLRRGKTREAGGKTIFTSPTGVGGMKTKLGQ